MGHPITAFRRALAERPHEVNRNFAISMGLGLAAIGASVAALILSIR